MRGLFVPGVFCDSSIWEQAPDLLSGCDVSALEWPHPERIDSLDDGAAWLEAEIASHRPDFVVGHSFGGVLALHLFGASARPAHPKTVIVDSFLVEPHPFFRNHVWQDRPDLRDRIAGMIDDGRRSFPRLGAVAALPHPPGRLERARSVEAVYIFGGRTGEHAPREVGKLAGAPPDAPVILVPETSHFPMLEDPEGFYAALRSFL